LTDQEKIVVLGLGNLLKGDDGVGVRVIEALQSGPELPRGVECIDGGTGGPTLLVYFEEADALIVVDAVNLAAAPGTVRVFALEEIEDADEPARFSLHDVGILPMIELARQLGRCPPVVRIVGVEPERFDLGDRLSPVVAVAVSVAVEVVRREVERITGSS
jgi:hydrogenase maturation protease